MEVEVRMERIVDMTKMKVEMEILNFWSKILRFVDTTEMNVEVEILTFWSRIVDLESFLGVKLLMTLFVLVQVHL
jgi:hypothetical protein